MNSDQYQSHFKKESRNTGNHSANKKPRKQYRSQNTQAKKKIYSFPCSEGIIRFNPIKLEQNKENPGRESGFKSNNQQKIVFFGLRKREFKSNHP